MSIVITGTDLTIIYFLLIALNGFFCYQKVPILAFPIVGISVLFLIGFQTDYNGIGIILTLLLIVFTFGSAITNWNSYKK
jgi:hypothetical protein